MSLLTPTDVDAYVAAFHANPMFSNAGARWDQHIFERNAGPQFGRSVGTAAGWASASDPDLRAAAPLLVRLLRAQVTEELFQARDAHGPRSVGALTFVDGAVGGSGFLDRAAREMHLVAARAVDHLDHPNCESACYRCLKSYNNQRHHGHLFWPEIISELEAIAATPPTDAAAELGDNTDPRPWLEAFDAGVGSPLELKFLRLFEKHGIDVEKQVAIAPRDGEAPLSTADFVLKGQRVAIYVDGAAFHRGQRLRRDRFIRQKLEDGGWRVVVLRASDLGLRDVIIGELVAPRASMSGKTT